MGFAEGFAITAIIAAITRGIEIARTGQFIARSPPKILVVSKYSLMFIVWLSLSWNCFISIWEILTERFNFPLPPLQVHSFFYLMYNTIIIPFSKWFELIFPVYYFIPFLLLPLTFIFFSSYKFLAITIVTPRIKDSASVFYLLISTVFVLILTNIFNVIDELNIENVKLLLFEISIPVLKIFDYFEALAFFSGLIFAVSYTWMNMKSRRQNVQDLFTPSSVD